AKARGGIFEGVIGRVDVDRVEDCVVDDEDSEIQIPGFPVHFREKDLYNGQRAYVVGFDSKPGTPMGFRPEPPPKRFDEKEKPYKSRPLASEERERPHRRRRDRSESRDQSERRQRRRDRDKSEGRDPERRRRRDRDRSEGRDPERRHRR